MKSGNSLRPALGGLVAFAMVCASHLDAVPVTSQVVVANNQQLIIEPQREVLKDPFGLSIRDLSQPSVTALSTAANPLAGLGGGVGGIGLSPVFYGGGGGGGGGSSSYTPSSPLGGVSFNRDQIVTGYNTTVTNNVAAAVSAAAAAAADPFGVPEGGATIILLGCALLALFFLGRRWIVPALQRQRVGR